jgi:transposase
VHERYAWLWLYVAVEPTLGRLICWVLPGVDSACFATFLHALRAELPDERVGVVLDNAPSHRSGQVMWPDGFVPMPLPAYSPELNPAEQIFRHLRKRLANQVFDDLAALQAALTHALAELWTQPHVVVRLTAYPWWVKGMQANMPLIS